MNEQDLRTALTRVAERAHADPSAIEEITSGRRRLESRRHALGATGVIAVIAALTIMAVQVIQSDRANVPPDFASGDPTIVAASAEAIAFTNLEGDLAVYDVSDDMQYALLDDGDPSTQERFGHVWSDRDVRWVSIDRDAQRSQLWTGEYRSGGEKRMILEMDGVIDAIGYGPGDRTAFILNQGGTQQSVYLYIPLTIAGEPGGQPSAARGPIKIYDFPEYLGRGINSDDEVHVEWSSTGRNILVVNTYVDTAAADDDTLLVFDLEGRQMIGNDPVAPRNGTHARWSARETICYLPMDAADDTWRLWDVASGDEFALPIDLPGATRPALSPDGTRLAVENEGSNSVVILHLDRGTTSIVPGAAPLWIGLDRLLVSELEECDPVTCEGSPWRPTGHAYVVDGRVCDHVKRCVQTTPKLHSIFSTYDASAWFAPTAG